MSGKKTHFCMECRREAGYRIQRVTKKVCIRDKEYEFEVSEGVCENCGGIANIPGLMDSNAMEIDRQYRMRECIVKIDDIYNVMEVYNIGKAPLSLALGFGEITITRYLAGQVPSKEYSDIIRAVLESPTFMVKKLNENAEKIGETAYRKSMKAAKDLEPLFALSEPMLLSISYLFKKVEEITPLALQKMLYYVQGIHMALFGKEAFCEECEAWAHGPVFRAVYEVFKSFKYNPIDDARFTMFQNRWGELPTDVRKVIDMVAETFGMYSGKVLEHITHKEEPWIEARVNCLPGEVATEVIQKERIRDYFVKVREEYGVEDVRGLRRYIGDKLKCA